MNRAQFRKIMEIMIEVRDTIKEVHRLQKQAMEAFNACRVNHLLDEEE